MGDVMDMSAGGMRISMTGSVRPKEDEVFMIKLVGISDVVMVRCRVAWVADVSAKKSWTSKIRKLIGGTRFDVGLEFVDLTPEARRVISEIGAAAGKNETIRPDIERFRHEAA